MPLSKSDMQGGGHEQGHKNKLSAKKKHTKMDTTTEYSACIFDCVVNSVDLIEIICQYLPVVSVARLALTSKTISDATQQLHGLRREVDAAKQLVELYGFSPDHLYLFLEYYKINQPDMLRGSEDADVNDAEGRLTLTWEAQLSHWRNRVDWYHEHSDSSQELVQWVQRWNAQCSDASRPRALVALPGETIACTVDHLNRQTRNTAIIQMQIAIDSYQVVEGNRGEISQICHGSSSGVRQFDLIAPDRPGLYMIWHNAGAHYSFQQAAAEQWPDYIEALKDWRSVNFVAWLRVDPCVTPRAASDSVSLQNVL